MHPLRLLDLWFGDVGWARMDNFIDAVAISDIGLDVPIGVALVIGRASFSIIKACQVK